MVKNKKRADGRVKSSVYIGNGKYKYVYAKNNRELEKKVQEVKLKLGKGIDVSADRDTFGEWAQRWLKIKKTQVSDKQYKAYAGRVKRLSELSDCQISKIRTADLQSVIFKLSDDGMAKLTLERYKSVFRQIMELAIENRVMDYNPANGVKIPNTETDDDKDPRRALTEEEQAWITAPTNHRGQLPAMIMMYAGLRRGELIPLTWRDIDIDNRTITVNKAAEVIDGKMHIKPRTKTEAGMRVVHIPKKLADYLKEQPRGENLLVCPDTKGRMMSESAWKRLWDSYLAELNFNFGDFTNVTVTDESTGRLKKFEKPASRFAPVKIPFVIPRFTAHWLRHTFITMMYFAGVDVMTAKEQAGHADIKTTMDIYTHLDKQYKQKQISKLDEFLSKNEVCGSNAGQAI